MRQLMEQLNPLINNSKPHTAKQLIHVAGLATRLGLKTLGLDLHEISNMSIVINNLIQETKDRKPEAHVITATDLTNWTTFGFPTSLIDVNTTKITATNIFNDWRTQDIRPTIHYGTVPSSDPPYLIAIRAHNRQHANDLAPPAAKRPNTNKN